MNKVRKTPLEYKYRNAHPFKTLYHLFDGDIGRIALALLFFAIKHSPVWILPIVIARMITIISNPKIFGLHDLWVVGGIFSILIVQNIPGHTLFTHFFAIAIHNMQARLRSALIRRVQELSIAVHDDFHSGRLQAKVLRDVETVQNLSRHLVNSVFPAMLGIIVAFSVTLRKEPFVALFYVVAVPVSSLLIRLFRSGMRTSNSEYRTEIEMMSARVSEMIEMIPVTRAHGAEQTEISKMDSHLEKIKRKGIRVDVIGALFSSSSWVSFQSFQLVCLLFTSYMAYHGKISVGEVVLYQSYFTIIVGSVNALLSVYPELSRGFESIRSMGEILECPDIEQNQGKKPVTAVSGNLVFDSVEFTYAGSETPAVSGFALEVAAGKSIAFVGESGSGKSTIMSLIIGFRRPTKGRILLDGIDMQSLDLRQYRRYLAVVSQNTILFSGSIRENIAYGLDNVSEARLHEVIELANAADFIANLPQELDTPIGEHGAKLSGGQRQRIAIARALIRDPKVIIFDEATSALDVISESLVQQAIQRLIKGRTTFIVAHRLSTIRNADHIMVMKNGRQVESGSHDELIRNRGEFFKLKALQI